MSGEGGPGPDGGREAPPRPAPRDPFERAVEGELRRPGGGQAGLGARGSDAHGNDADGTDAGLDPAIWGRPGPAGEGDARPGRRAGVPSVPGRVPGGRRPPVPEADAPGVRGGPDAARGAPDYVGDYPHTVPRWDPPGEGAHPPPAHPSGRPPEPSRVPESSRVPEASRGDGRSDAAPGRGGPVGADPADGRLPARGGGWFGPGVGNARLCHVLNAVLFFTPVSQIASCGFAFMNRGRVGADLASHYTYALRTVGLGFLYALALNILATADGGVAGWYGVAALVWFGWYLGRCLRGVLLIGAGRAVPNPRTWLL